MKKIYDTRQSQAEQQQQQQQQFLNPQQPQIALMQQQMAMQGMNQNQFSQAYAIPQQPHVQNFGNPMQHHQSQGQRLVQPTNPIEMQQQMGNGQSVPNMAQRPPQTQGQPQFTPQEQQQIMQLAENMAHNVSPEQMNNVQRMIMSIPVDQRQQMQSQGVNPAHAVFRSHAIKRFLQERAIQQQRAGQGPHPLDRSVVSQQGRPTSQVSMRQGQQVSLPPTPQHHEPSFDQFLGQQQDALRHQEAGQVVVPASQGGPPQARATPRPQPPGQFGARPMQPPNNFQQQPPAAWTTPQGQHQNVPQTAQPQIPPQTPNLANMPGQNPQQQALQGQLGGLDNSRAQRTPQQNPNMPTLNRPLNPPNQAQNTQRQAQPTPKTGTRSIPSGQQTTVVAKGQSSVGQQSAPPNIQKFHKYVANLPESQRAAFVAKFKQSQERKKAEEAAEAAAQAGPPSAPVAPMGGQGGKAQPTPKGNPNVPQPSTNPMNRLNGQAQASQQSGPSSGARGPPQKFVPISLDENTIRMMDRVEFPRSLLALAGDAAKVPEHIKQWGQFKQWVQENSSILPTGTFQKAVGLQSIVFQQKVAQNNQQREALNQAQSQGNTRPTQPGVAPAAQMVAPNNSQNPIQGSTVQAPNASVPILPPPTIQEVTAARAQLPANMQPVSDDQLRSMILNKRKHEYYNKAMQSQQGLTSLQQQQQHQHELNMVRIQANVQQPQGPMQSTQHGQLQTPQRGQNPQPQPMQQWPQSQTTQKMGQANPQQAKQPQPSRSGPQVSVPQPIQKGGKRNNNSDDVIEVPDPKLSQQQARPPNLKGPQPQPQPPPSNGTSQMTAEKYNSLPPEQKIRFQEHRRLQMEASQRATAQRLGQNVQGQRPVAEAVNQTVVPNAGRDGRVKELRSEVMRSLPTRQPIPMSPNTRARMIEKLKSAGAMARRLESSLPLYLSLSKDEERTKDLLRSVGKFVKKLEAAN